MVQKQDLVSVFIILAFWRLYHSSWNLNTAMILLASTRNLFQIWEYYTWRKNAKNRLVILVYQFCPRVKTNTPHKTIPKTIYPHTTDLTSRIIPPFRRIFSIFGLGCSNKMTLELKKQLCFACLYLINAQLNYGKCAQKLPYLYIKSLKERGQKIKAIKGST